MMGSPLQNEKMMISLTNLVSFCAAYEHKSFSNAAKVLGKDRTTIREQITFLEDVYDVKLFDVVGRKLQPTPAAKLIYDRARLTVVSAKQLDISLLDFHSIGMSELTIYHDTVIPLELISSINRTLSNKFPYLRTNWLHRNNDESLKLISQGDNCLALTQRHSNLLKNVPAKFISLGSERLAPYTSTFNSLATIDSPTVVDLQTQKQYVTENQFNWRPEFFCVSPDIHVVSNTDVLVELLKEDGWAILASEVAKPYVKQGILVELPWCDVINKPLCDISMYYPPQLENNAVFDVIKKEVVKYSKKVLV